jgi:hypothetical protein
MLRQTSWKILGGLHCGVNSPAKRREAAMVYLPRTLHGRLYLLSYDRELHQFDDHDLLFTFALRAAMLTDLYLTGYLTDEGDWAYVSDAARPDDPIGCGVRSDQGRRAHGLGRVDHHRRMGGAGRGSRPAQRRRLAHASTGSRHHPRLSRRALRRRPGAWPGDQVAEALRNAIDGRPAEPRLLAVGLLGVLGQMPTILSFKECAQHRQRLREMTLATTPPILALHKAIQTYHDEMRRWV